MRVKYHLNNTETPNKEGECNIRLGIMRNYERMFWYTGHTIKKEYWDAKHQRAIINDETLKIGLNYLNDFLDKVKIEVERLWRRECLTANPQLSHVKQNLNLKFKQLTSIKDFEIDLMRDRKFRETLSLRYMTQLAIKQGFTTEFINTNPEILEIKKKILLIKRKLKTNEQTKKGAASKESS